MVHPQSRFAAQRRYESGKLARRAQGFVSDVRFADEILCQTLNGVPRVSILGTPRDAEGNGAEELERCLTRTGFGVIATDDSISPMTSGAYLSNGQAASSPPTRFGNQVRVKCSSHEGLHYLRRRHSDGVILYPGDLFHTVEPAVDDFLVYRFGEIDPSVRAVLVGRAFWGPLLDWLEQGPVAGGYMKRSELERMRLVDTTADAVSELEGLTTRPREPSDAMRYAEQFEADGQLTGSILGQSSRDRATILGAGAAKRNSPEYNATVELGKLLAELFDIFTGGGPGLMCAGNRGGRGFGINLLKHPVKQAQNPHCQDFCECRTSVWRRMFLLNGNAINFFGPVGTVGSIDEMLKILHAGGTVNILVIEEHPTFWDGFIAWVRHQVVGNGYAEPEILARIKLFNPTAARREIERLAIRLSPVAS